MALMATMTVDTDIRIAPNAGLNLGSSGIWSDRYNQRCRRR